MHPVVWGNYSMSVDVFAGRLARVRQRFVSTLESKIDDAYAAMSNLSDVAETAAAAVEATYRAVHGVVGIGPTVGFPSTGRAAREVESILKEPYQKRRGLSAEEILLVKERLHALRQVASHELQLFHSQ
jgi:chemotaxis protein histidine kinase CheA